MEEVDEISENPRKKVWRQCWMLNGGQFGTAFCFSRSPHQIDVTIWECVCFLLLLNFSRRLADRSLMSTRAGRTYCAVHESRSSTPLFVLGRSGWAVFVFRSQRCFVVTSLLDISAIQGPFPLFGRCMDFTSLADTRRFLDRGIREEMMPTVFLRGYQTVNSPISAIFGWICLAISL